MRRKLAYFFLVVIASQLLSSCQRELEFETVPQVAAGSLKSNATGDCLPKTVGGTYKEGITLGDTNYIMVDVNVTSVGPYTITTDTVNGYSFKATGTFASTGSNTIRLAGSGKPIAADTNHLKVRYDTSMCSIEIIVAPAIAPIKPAVFTLQGAPDTCVPATVFGSYVKDHLLNASDTVMISLQVITPGSYTISTNMVNGYSFSGSGILTGTGLQTVVLTGTGMPLTTGKNTFTVSAATGCTFSVTVTAAIAVTGLDYFPLTKNSYWSYDNLLYAGDTVKRIITDTVRTNGILYNIMEEHDMYGGNIPFYYRKNASDYFEYGPLDKYTASFSFYPQISGEIPFLKEGLSTGSGWTTGEMSGTFSGGQTIYLQYDFYCTDADAAVTVNGKSFINVYKITVFPQVRSAFAPLSSTGEIIELNYARGVGLIYIKSTRDGNTTKEWRIRNWLVN